MARRKPQEHTAHDSHEAGRKHDAARKDDAGDAIAFDFSGVGDFFKRIHLETAVTWALLIAVMVLVFWIRMLPAQLDVTDDWAENAVRQSIQAQVSAEVDRQYPNLPQANRDRLVSERTAKMIVERQAEFDAAIPQISQQYKDVFRYQGEDGKQYTYLGDLDSYFWLRYTRNILRHGYACDAIVDGECRDMYVLAPVGSLASFNPSLHVFAILGLYKFITIFNPQFPLPATSFLVPVILGTLCAIPAFFIGRKLAGNVGGVFAAILIALSPLYLSRSMGSDNDAWNLIFPLFTLWMIILATDAKTRLRKGVYAALAGLFVALHAATWEGWWFIYLIVLFGLIGYLALLIIGATTDQKNKHIVSGALIIVYALGLAIITREQKTDPFGLALLGFAGIMVLIGIAYAAWHAVRHQTPWWRDANVIGAVIVLGVFYVATFLLLVPVGKGDASYFQLPLASLSTGSGLDRAVGNSYWPNVLTTVAELNKSSFGEAVSSMGGKLFFFISLLGISLLLMPKKQWDWKLLSVLAVSAGIAAYLVNATALGKFAILALLTFPAAVIIIYLIWQHDTSHIAGALILIVWFLASVYATYSGVRFILLLIPAYGIAFGVAAGRCYQWVTGYLQREFERPAWLAAFVIPIIVFLVFSLMLVQPIKSGYGVGRGFLPSIDDAWWDALTKINKETAPDAIINSWWDFGHWFKYIADRRVTGDGTTQHTHVPRWLGLVLVTTSEDEAMGTLRMLNCGSDAYPAADGALGAYGRIVAKLGDPIRSEALLREIILLSRSKADAHLAKEGFAPAERESVLAASHCQDVPEDYLITSQDMIGKAGVWAHFGLWNFSKAYIVETAKTMSEQEAVADYMSRFGMTETTATDLYYQARSLTNEGEINAFASPWPGYLGGNWIACRRVENDTVLGCPIGMQIGSQNGGVTAIDAFIINLTNPSQNNFVYGFYQSGQRVGGIDNGTAGMVVLAGKTKMDTMEIPGSTSPGIAVLVDTVENRVLLADPLLIKSQFTMLYYLDGRYSEHFVKFDEQSSPAGTRVVVWKVDWDGKDAGSATSSTAIIK